MHKPERFNSPEYLAALDEAGSSEVCRFSVSALHAMKQAAENDYPLEACGLLIGTIGNGWQIDEARQVENLNKARAADRFQLDPAGYRSIDHALRGTGREIIGVFHSHPDCPANPSPTDLESAWEGFAYPIISVCNGEVSNILCWTLNEDGNRFQSLPIRYSRK
ncbi:MAG: M67 family metallopeptidase [Mariprofundaceae bacterium]|nr:M67 family metallopeptidase [Mariprofundaceae bacterium]